MLKNIPREDVLDVVKKIGPTIPVRIVKTLGGDTFLIGAILSDLVNNKFVKVSTVKIGGTPFYYVDEQLNKLEQLSIHLNEKDKQTFDLLKEKKILKDEDQTPLVRVSLRNIKDFAIPVEVSSKNGDNGLFWKYYLLSNTDVEKMLKEMHRQKKSAQSKTNEQKEEKTIEATDNIETVNEEQEVLMQKQEIQIPKKEITQVQENITRPKKTTIHKPVQTKIEQSEIKKESEPDKKIIEKDTQKEKPATKTSSRAEKQVLHDEHDKEIDKKPQSMPKTDKEAFMSSVEDHFVKKNIEIVEKTIIRKGEIDYIVRIPSPIGVMEYFCKARDKKKISEGDVATAFIQGQQKKLPVLYLTTGEVNKKTKDMLNKEFKGVIINNI